MRILFTTQPAYGHLGPLLPVARAAAAAGHEVRVASAPGFALAIRDAGLEPVPSGIDWAETDNGLIRAFPDLANHPGTEKGNRFVIGTLYAERTAAATFRDLREVVGPGDVDLIVRGTFEFGGALLAAALDVPCAVVQVGALATFERDRHLAAEGVARAAATLGLEAFDAEAATRPGALLSFAPPSFQDPDWPIPAGAQAFRTASGDTPRLPEHLLPLARGRTIYMTLGTVFTTYPPLYRHMLDAVAELDADVILALGTGTDPEALGPTPANARVERFVPQRAVVPHADLVVCHAGFGTVLDALSAGVPMVLTPYSADQPLNAARCEALGVAETLPFLEADADALRDRIVQVLEADAYRAAAQRIRNEILTLPGPDAAVGVLERLADEPPEAMRA